MRVVGITGGIATGKSTVAAMFAERGAARIDSDELARAAVEPCQPAYHAVVARFGPSYVRPDGSLDRRALGDLVFRDDAARADLEAIIHPQVTRAIQQRLAALRQLPCPPPLVVVEIPLLFEVGLEYLVDKTIAVSSEQRTQLQRLTTRTGLPPDEAMLRIAAQMPRAEKERRADFVIDTDQPLEAVRQEVDRVWRSLVA
ncbi:MAG: dephospho-CoA kinase [Armatimonadetes bacterium]|jgi:dephospho-CoA kinase|nr:dephospho-CoA kinase [Armatimonadota bacterium]